MNWDSAIGIGSMLGSGIGALDSLGSSSTGFGSFMSGAGGGAAAGMSFGPIGAGIGALIGGGVSLFSNRKEEQRMAEMKRQQEEMRKKAELNVRRQRQEDLNSRFNAHGMDVPGFYAKGGMLPGQYVAEGEEIVEHNPWDIPVAHNANTQQLSLTGTKLKGQKHSGPDGGIHASGGERVYSDQIKISDEDLKMFKI